MDKWIGLISVIVIMLMSIILVLMAIQSTKMTEIGEKTVALETSLRDTPQKLSDLTDKVTHLETSLARVSDALKAHADRLGDIAADLNTTQTTLTQFVEGLSAVSGDVKALGQRITEIEGTLKDRFQQVDTKFTNLDGSVAKIGAIQESVMVLNKKLSGIEKELITKTTNINQMIDDEEPKIINQTGQ